MKLREKQMEERRSRILDTAERLIREIGSTDFSVRKLAADAEVSPTTPFNLFGSKEGILFTLLLRSLDLFMERGLTFRAADPELKFVEASRAAAAILVKDAGFFRPLYKVLMGVTHPTHRPVFMRQTFEYWRQVALSVPLARGMRDEKQINLLAHSFMSHFTGLMEMWINGDLSNKQFIAQVKCAAIIDAYRFVPSSVRSKLNIALDQYMENITFSGIG